MDRRSITALIAEGVLDGELAALLWQLAVGGLPIHVAADDPGWAAEVAAGLAGLPDRAGQVDVRSGDSLEAVLGAHDGDPASLGVVVILDARRVVAAHYVRPPLRDAGGHLHEQRPAVLATWDVGLGSFEDFAWGITPELAQRVGRRPGDFELERDRRREYLDGLVAGGVTDATAVAVALTGFGAAMEQAHPH
jgi:hypothetical protein